jgi:DNA-directed RNA polymerase specialized sigma24 family protein
LGADVPEALEGGENQAGLASCPLDAESRELSMDGLVLLDRALGGEESEHTALRRRGVDGKIVERLRAEEFKGRNYEKVVNRLMEYGYHTMIKWTASGAVFQKARLVGRPVPEEKITLVWTSEDRHGVAVDSVLGGLNVFRTYGLIQGGWRPDGGASLDTYFIGAVIRAFPRVYSRWFNSHQHRQAELDHPSAPDLDDPFSLVPDQRATDPLHAAQTQDYIERLLPLVTDSQVREALGWRALGYSQAQAACRVDLTEKALERRLSRLRVRLVQQVRPLELGEGGTR